MNTENRFLKGLLVDDHVIVRAGIKLCLQNILNIKFEEFSDGVSALNRLEIGAKQNDDIDFIITDINHLNLNGIELIERVRNFSNHYLYHNGLRLKHIPIIVLTMSDSDENRDKVKTISKNTPYLLKDVSGIELAKEIIKSISTYRKKITEEFIDSGYSIHFENGKYIIDKSYSLDPLIKTKYFEGISDEANKSITRNILVQNNIQTKKLALNIFEDLINNKNSNEHELEDFFRCFPDFLLDHSYDILYPQMSFNHLNADKYRTDLIAQPKGMSKDEDKWRLFELKKHTHKILTSTKYHVNFSKVVFNAITQLRNYSEFFNDPKNEQEIRNRFGGIKPSPKLSLVIGRTPKDKVNFIKLKNQYPDISITTYDEILNFKKIQIDYSAVFGK